jgi:hypothetical protein
MPSSSGTSACRPPKTITGKPGVMPSAEDRSPHQTPSGSTTQMRAAEVRSSSTRRHRILVGRRSHDGILVCILQDRRLNRSCRSCRPGDWSSRATGLHSARRPRARVTPRSCRSASRKPCRCCWSKGCFLPLASAKSYVVTVKTWLPAGTLIEAVQVYAPGTVALGEQFADDGIRLTTTGVAPSVRMRNDWVLGETYWGAIRPVFVFGLIRIANVTFPYGDLRGLRG